MLLVAGRFNTRIPIRSPFIASFHPVHFAKQHTRGLEEKQDVRSLVCAIVGNWGKYKGHFFL